MKIMSKSINVAFDAHTPENTAINAIISTLPDKTGMAGRILKVSSDEYGCEWVQKASVFFATLSVSGWNTENKTQTIYNQLITENSIVLVNPVKSSCVPYTANNVYVESQADGCMKFACVSIPNTNIEIRVIIL